MNIVTKNCNQYPRKFLEFPMYTLLILILEPVGVKLEEKLLTPCETYGNLCRTIQKCLRKWVHWVSDSSTSCKGSEVFQGERRSISRSGSQKSRLLRW